MRDGIRAGSTRYYVGQQEVSEDVYRTASDSQRQRDRAARSEKEFVLAEDAFAYVDTLRDGVVLDWGRCYAAMERHGLGIGFAIEPDEQPIVTPDDLRARPGPGLILARRNVRECWTGVQFVVASNIVGQ